jgi:2-keto-4-pentenoate hydratase
VTVSIEHAVETIWKTAQAGVYFPGELKGKLATHQGYETQLGVLARHLAAGDAHVGWKVGLTSKATQDAVGLYEPAFGYLLAGGAKPNGTVFPTSSIPCGFENELCLTVGKALQGPGVTLEQARASIAAVAPALEIIEMRGDLKGEFGLALADNLFHKAFVTGQVTRPLPDHVDLSKATVDVFVNGRHSERALGSEVLGHPAASVAWLANKLAEFGRRLEAGMQIMSGSITRIYPAKAGDAVEARFEPFGTVTASFR